MRDASLMLIATYGSESYRIQLCENRGKIWHRNYVNGTWTSWFGALDDIPKTYIVRASASQNIPDLGIYKSLAEAIEEAVKTADSTIYVEAGEYDILSEYQALHPDDWATRNDHRGINLYNGLHLIFASDATVICNYTGDNNDVLRDFSAFNIRYQQSTQNHPVVIENMNVSASRIRYCVHDDMSSFAYPYHNTYKNCIMRINNSENPGYYNGYPNDSRSKYPHCIGGGFGKNGHIVIEDCIFEGIGGNGTTYPAPDDTAIVSWHNGPNASQKSDLFMSGCYFKGVGSFRAMSNGTETRKSTLLISGNSFGSSISEGFSPGASIENMEIISFNNEVRN